MVRLLNSDLGDVSTPALTSVGPSHLPEQWVHGLFPGSKAAGAKY